MKQRFTMEIPVNSGNHPFLKDNETGEIVEIVNVEMLIKRMNEQQATINDLEKQRDYWKNKAMTLLMQVRRLTSRMTDKEVKEFSKELEE